MAEPLARLEITASRLDCTDTLAGQITPHLTAMDGTHTTDVVLNGVEFRVWYDQHGAHGDDGRPVAGDVTGDFEVATLVDGGIVGGKRVGRAHVGPHGTSGYGNPAAKSHGAHTIACALVRHAERVAT